MALGLSIMNVHFDAIRRGVKKVEYRPISEKYYVPRFENKNVTEIIFGHQRMRDKLLCRVLIEKGALPPELVGEWQRIYKNKHPYDLVYCINIIGIPKYFVSDKHQYLPIMFSA